MGFNNPGVPWSEVERRLSDRWDDVDPMAQRHRKGGHPGDGGDSPAWSASREAYEAPADLVRAAPSGSDAAHVPYAELHCHSSFSFLDGASSPESLAEEATRLGLDALAVTDHDGFYGVVRFAEAARALGLPTVFGAELTLNSTGPRAPAGPKGGAGSTGTDPDGRHLVVLARDPVGYACLAGLISEAQMNGEKGRPSLSFAALAEAAGGRARGHWAVLTGCRKGLVPAALEQEGARAAQRRLRSLVAAFGADSTFVELWDHGQAGDSGRNDAMASIAARVGVATVATNNVHHATPGERMLAASLAAVRARRSLDEIDGWLPASGAAHLRSGAEQLHRFARYPGAVEVAARLGQECAFDLSLVAPQLPPYPCPPGPDGSPISEAQHLRGLVEEGAIRRYGTRHAERVSGAWAQVDRELDLIESLGFAGYFLIVWDIVEFCRQHDIYCQGRGSAANSAVCYVLGVTNADAVGLGLLFERFLSPERDGPPDIDIDIESGRREEVIQYVYGRYGRSHAAQVANVITYRSRSAVRDAARALGFDPGQQDAWSKSLDRWGGVPEPGTGDIPETVLDIARQMQDLPRHLGIHSGGMVICDRPVSEVCPVEWARMKDRSVLQWDKDDCAAAGLVKFDLLGLGMLTALHLAVDLIAEHEGVVVDLAELPQEDDVYEMLCNADSIGVFQVESRAQMSTLPRLAPRCFYDLVIEVALIRPGPIQGGSVHPYIRRRRGEEKVTYLHPLLEKSLKKTLGVPLFQEQLMQMAIDVAGFTPAEADQLRQAMGNKRSDRRMAELRERFDVGVAERGITGAVAEELWAKLAAFANYGFPESHSVSFAYLVYASAWIKFHYPAAFCAALLNAQPMGFYSPQSLVQDARRHGVPVLTPDVVTSDWCATLEPGHRGPQRQPLSLRTPMSPGDGESVAVRLGLSSVRTIGDDVARRIVEGRPYCDIADLAQRVELNRAQLEALAAAGALQHLGDEPAPLDRRAAIWSAGAAAQLRHGQLPGMAPGMTAPQLPGMEDWEVAVADLWATGVAPDGHPTTFLRADLDRRGVVTARELRTRRDGDRIVVAGVVTHRQRPATAAGITFINLEDETGFVNVVVSRGCWARHRRVATAAPALLVSGRLERSTDDVCNVIAERIELLPVTGRTSSRNFR